MSYPIHRFFSHELSRSPLPAELWNIQDPPTELTIQGRTESLAFLSQLPDRGLAIVGTREPQSRSLDLVQREVARLGTSRMIIISGFANGVDAVAHRAAISAGLPTIAILGGGIDIDYPPQNRLLREAILKSGGLLVSEFPMGNEPKPWQFIQRNRIIAAWARATWVVEAGHRSGALNTAKWAHRHDRFCFATSSFPGDPAFAGNERLLNGMDFKGEVNFPFYTANNLSPAWLELISLGKRPPRSGLVILPNDRLLAKKVERLTFEQGGAQVQEILDWGLSLGWSPQDFFSTLERALQSGQIEDQSGKLVVPQI